MPLAPIPRDPEASKRSRDFQQKVRDRLNALERLGELSQTALGDYSVAASGGMVISQRVFATRGPAGYGMWGG